MYITYETTQWSKNYSWVVEDDAYGSFPQIVKKDQPLQTIPDDLPKTEFMPTKLVRISDMEVVDSSLVEEGYCALSYSWSWSGDYVFDEIRQKYKRIDEGKHKIIYIDQNTSREEQEDNSIQYKEKHVQFEDVIQQICQQFNIKYLWFDQMCINQHDKDDIYREIRKMHTIYDNAYCTVVLVPEFRVELDNNCFSKNKQYHLLPDYPNEIHNRDSPDQLYSAAALGIFKAQEDIQNSDWYKRLWTLEEAIKSNKLLFVGQNTHVFGHHLIPGHKIAYLTMPSEQVKLNQVLFHAHRRTSSKEHDRVFALANIFPDIIQQLDINYDQPLEDLMLQFYCLVAKKDITILHFEGPLQYTSTVQQYDFLPSWTGVHGMHNFCEPGPVTFKDYDIIGNVMHVTSVGITNASLQNNADCSLTLLRSEDLPLIPDGGDGDESNLYSLHLLVQLSGQTDENKTISLPLWSSSLQHEDASDRIAKISKDLQVLSKFMEIRKENLFWSPVVNDIPSFGFNFDHLTEEVVNDPSVQYVILSDICFPEKTDDDDNLNNVYYSPVIRKKNGEEYYKAIGTIWTCSYNTPYIFSNCNELKQTFLIQ